MPCRTPGINGSTSFAERRQQGFVPSRKHRASYKSRCPGQLGEDSVEAEVLPQKRRSTFGSRARCSRGLLSPAGFRKEMLRAPWASVAAPRCSTKAVQKEDRFSGFLRAAPAKDPAGLGRLPTRGIRRRRHGNGSAVCPGPTGPSAAWEDVFGRTHEYFRAAPVV